MNIQRCLNISYCLHSKTLRPFLGVALEADIKLVRGNYLVQLARDPGGRLMRRQEMVPRADLEGFRILFRSLEASWWVAGLFCEI